MYPEYEKFIIFILTNVFIKIGFWTFCYRVDSKYDYYMQLIICIKY